MRPNTVIAIEPLVVARDILRRSRDDFVRDPVGLRRACLAKLERIYGESSRKLFEVLLRGIAHAQHHGPRYV